MKKRIRLLFVIFIIALFLFWQFFPSEHWLFFVYFGRPSDILNCDKWGALLVSGLVTLITAIVALIISGFTSLLLLKTGLKYKRGIDLIEKIAATTQVVPFILVIAFLLIFERTILGIFFEDREFTKLPIFFKVILPVSLVLIFPPLVNGAEAIIRTPKEIKGLIRLWNPRCIHRNNKVYIPIAISSMLSGIRTSATWAVAATVITEGLIGTYDSTKPPLGHYLLKPFTKQDPSTTLAAFLLTSILGFIVYHGFKVFQRIFEKCKYGKKVEAEKAYPLGAYNGKKSEIQRRKR